MDHNLTSPSPRRQCTSPSYSVHSNESATPGSSDQTAQVTFANFFLVTLTCDTFHHLLFITSNWFPEIR